MLVWPIGICLLTETRIEFSADMTVSKSEKIKAGKASRKDRMVEIANTFEWLITAFILAFVFRAFVMEAYRIPTGSMADTLKGAHFRLRCGQCGYRYDYGFDPRRYSLPQDTIPRGDVRTAISRCPSCGHYQPTGGTMPIANGDRILVLKCIYQFFEPKQWDVIVFKNPLDPPINYIKRLIGRPGETVQIIDGDVYIDGQISRKPPKVQDELWMPVYNNDYQPALPLKGSFNGHIWQQPFRMANPKWKIDEANPAIFHLCSPADEINTMSYDTSIGNNFRASYAYDEIKDYDYLPYCSDLKVRFYIRPTDANVCVGMSMSKYRTNYKAWVDFGKSQGSVGSTCEMLIAKVSKSKEVILARKSIKPPAIGDPVLAQFTNVDHQLTFQFGGEKLTYDLGRFPDDVGYRETDVEPKVEIFGSGKLALSHVAIFKDIHYTAINGPAPGRATESNPFKLEEDEFFVLGDNSPNSADGRWWSEPGRGNNGLFYRQGIVPREYLVGQALFVYWPSWFRPFGKSSPVFVPNVGGMRFIYGGSNEKL
jgi:signal peptidase I